MRARVSFLLVFLCACNAITGLDKEYLFTDGGDARGLPLDASTFDAASDSGSHRRDSSPSSDGSLISDVTLDNEGSMGYSYMSTCYVAGTPGDCEPGLMCEVFVKGKFCTKSCTMGVGASCPSPSPACTQGVCQPP